MKLKVLIPSSILFECLHVLFCHAAILDSDSLAMLHAQVHNGDYLNYVQKPPSSQSMQAILFDRSISLEMSDKYNGINRNYEMRRNYHLDELEDQIRFQASDQALIGWSVRRMIQYHFERIVKDARDSPQNSTNPTPVQSVLKTAHVLQNPIFAIDENTKTNLKYDLAGRKVNLGVTSSLVNGNFSYAMRHQDSMLTPDATFHQLSIGLNKDLQLISTNAQMRYGMTDRSLYYGASKKILGPLSTQVGQTRYPSAVGGTETVGRLNIGFGF